ncbi:hypothetical protein Tco_1150027 [Tanacetum coccineum]
MNCIEEIAKDAKVIEIDNQLLVLIKRQVKTELMLEEKFRDLCEEVSNFVKEIEDVVKEVERLSCKDVAKETVCLLRRGQKRELYMMTRLQMMADESHLSVSYMHVGTDLDVGVGFWYSQESSFNAYRFSIELVFGSNMWKSTNDVSPLPPLIRKMFGRPQKAIIKSLFEISKSQSSKVGRTMTCKNCWQKGHNKASCKADPQPKPIVEKKQPGRKKHVVVGQCDGSCSGIGGSGIGSGGRGGGGGSRGGRRDRRGGGMASRGGERCSRGGGSRRGGGMAGSSSMGVLTTEEEYQLELDEHTFREYTTVTTAYIDEALAVETSDTTKVGEEAQVVDNGKASTSNDKGKTSASVEDEPASKRKRGRPPSHVAGIKIYHKNRGRSERIANMKLKKPFQFDKYGIGSTPDKAFDVDE